MPAYAPWIGHTNTPGAFLSFFNRDANDLLVIALVGTLAEEPLAR